MLNGWQLIRDRNHNEAVGSQIQFRPSSKWLLNSSTFVGEGYNPPDSVGQQLRYFHDFYVAHDRAAGSHLPRPFQNKALPY